LINRKVFHTAGYWVPRLSRVEAFAAATSVALARAVFLQVIPLASQRESQHDGLHRLCTRHSDRNLHSRAPSMMTSRKLVDHVTAEPFRLFRIKMASGQSFDIQHPEMILVGRSSVRVYTAVGDDDNEKWHDVSLMLMETIEPLSAAVIS
jgi:hypothetical protein